MVYGNFFHFAISNKFFFFFAAAVAVVDEGEEVCNVRGVATRY